ncbi:MAG: class I SAM-dependent methyltransferase [Rikenellaceae bacterium]|nr:class I SAM-dependent methyltransferase [Rikenellaceae bacterium]
MSKVATAERVSLEKSDNYVFQRSVLAYHHAAELVEGDILEIGTGSGYGVEVIAPKATRYISIDKELPAVPLQLENVEYYDMEVPPIDFENCSFDSVVSFQVIEHIEEDIDFVREVARVLRPGGKFVVSTPNAPMSLTRNPWHVREYNADELRNLLECHFSKVEAYGVVGNEKIMEYYRKNRQSVRKITRFDILDLQHRLPRKLLQFPYDVLNRLNRRSLHKKNTSLTDSIVMSDYSIVPYKVGMECFDLFFVATK